MFGKSIQQQIKFIPQFFPPELAARVVQYYSFKEDLVFDPFGGSGTVGQVALAYERYFFLCEKEAAYVEDANQRLNITLSATIKPRFLSLKGFKAEISGTQKK